MAQQKTFGRKASAAPPAGFNRAPAPSLVSAETPPIEIHAAFDDPVAAELAEWKAQRRGGFGRLPWSQLSLMASLCFGIASFVLPASVNSWVDWLLYILSAISLIVWFKGRKKASPDAVR